MTSSETPHPNQRPGQFGGDRPTEAGGIPETPDAVDIGPSTNPYASTDTGGPSGSSYGQAGSGTTATTKEQGRQVAQDAKESGKQVAQDAKESGKQVAQTAQDEVRNVASTVTEQARHLLGETTSELGSQAGSQQQRLAEGLRSLSEQFGSMAQGSSDSSSQATGLVREASQRTEGLADWLEHHEPGDVVNEVKRFARRKPGAFIAIAAGVGLLAGRMTRSLTSDNESQDPSAVGTRGYQGSGYPGSTPEVATPGSYAAPLPSAGGMTPSGSPAAAPPVGGVPVDPGPMSGIGAGPTGGEYASDSAHPVASDRDLEDRPVYGDDPR